MLIILDLGANDGCSIIKFKDILKKKGVDDYLIYSFEPILFFKRYLEKLESDKVKIVYAAASTNNEDAKIYLSNNTSNGSSLHSDKRTNGVRKDKFINISCIDIDKFIKNIKNKYGNSELWVKMDIEGAEYDVIEHMNKYGSIKLIDKLFIEWHHKKIKSISVKRHYKCLKIVEKLNPEIWNSESFSVNSDLDEKYLEYIKSL